MPAFPNASPLVEKVQLIAHRGASVRRPEHTLAAYALAIDDGADFIEPDLVVTRDGVLIARHENAMGDTTDVASRPEFANRRRRKEIDGQWFVDWFCEDFSLAELKTLRVRERLPELRGSAYDGLFEITTLEEIIVLVDAASRASGRVIGLMPEIKHGSYFASLGLAMEDRLLAQLDAHAYTRRAPVEIQSFEIANLRYLRDRLGHRHPTITLLQLLEEPHMQPWDVVLAGGQLSYAAMMRPDGLRDIASYADAIGPDRHSVIPLDAGGGLAAPTRLVRDAHALGLRVQPYTFRPENRFLPPVWRCGDDPATVNAAGSIAEIRAYLAAGVDGFFTDAPALGRRAIDAC